MGCSAGAAVVLAEQLGVDLTDLLFAIGCAWERACRWLARRGCASWVMWWLRRGRGVELPLFVGVELDADAAALSFGDVDGVACSRAASSSLT
jgi:hypothetical protein